MIKKILLILLLAMACSVHAQQLYHRWFGPKDAEKTLVFLHGGPGYNAANFEFDMAPRLAKQGYQVLVYDQRGSGRSEGLKGEFTYAEAVEDLRGLLAAQGVTKAHLLGHSFGGTIAVEFAHAHPDKVASIVLISAPMNFPLTFRAIQNNCRMVLEMRDDNVGIQSIDALAKMDTTKLEYATTNFMYAMQNGLYTPTEDFKTALKVKKKLKKDPLGKWATKSSFAPIQGFYNKEQYTMSDHSAMLAEVAQTIPVHAILGDDDGLFDEANRASLDKVIGGERVYSLALASHAVFLDDPYGFLDAFAEIMTYADGDE